MNRMIPLLVSAAFAASAIVPMTASAAAAASPFIGDSGAYGALDINLKSNPRPALIFARPITAERGGEANKPLFLRVPKEYAKRWKDHCKEYAACDRPTYFVTDGWYTNTYVPALRSKEVKTAAP